MIRRLLRADMLNIFDIFTKRGSSTIAVVILNCSLIVTLSLFERAVTATYFFDYPTVIVTLQTAFVLLLIELARLVGLLKLSSYNLERGKDLFLPSLFIAIVTYISVNATEQCWGISVSMLHPIKQLGPLLAFCYTYGVQRHPIPVRSVFTTVVIIAITSCIATITGLSSDIWSYFLGFVLFTLYAISAVMFEGLSQQYSPTEMLYIYSFNSLVFLLIADLVEDEMRDSIIYFYMNSTSSNFIKTSIILLLVGAVQLYFLFQSYVYAGAIVTLSTISIASAVEVLIAYIFSVYIYFDRIPSFRQALFSIICIISGFILLKINPNMAHTLITVKGSNIFK